MLAATGVKAVLLDSHLVQQLAELNDKGNDIKDKIEQLEPLQQDIMQQLQQQQRRQQEEEATAELTEQQQQQPDSVEQLVCNAGEAEQTEQQQQQLRKLQQDLAGPAASNDTDVVAVSIADSADTHVSGAAAAAAAVAQAARAAASTVLEGNATAGAAAQAAAATANAAQAAELKQQLQDLKQQLDLVLSELDAAYQACEDAIGGADLVFAAAGDLVLLVNSSTNIVQFSRVRWLIVTSIMESLHSAAEPHSSLAAAADDDNDSSSSLTTDSSCHLSAAAEQTLDQLAELTQWIPHAPQHTPRRSKLHLQRWQPADMSMAARLVYITQVSPVGGR